MSSAAPMRSEIWRSKPEIWPDFAKSGILAQSGIWLFCRDFRWLMVLIQISEGVIRNLIRNLDFTSNISGFRQIPDFGKGTPKGVGAPPAEAGVHHPPLGDVPGPEPRPEDNPTTAAPYRQAPDRRRLPPEQPPLRGDHPWLTRL